MVNEKMNKAVAVAEGRGGEVREVTMFRLQ